LTFKAGINITSLSLPGGRLIVVTGAIGRSGKWFIQKLIDEKFREPIRFAYRKHHDLSIISQSNLNAEVLEGDLCDSQYIENVTKGADTVVHFAGIGRSKELIQACQKNKVQWAILVHTTGRYSKFKSAAGDYIEVDDWVLGSRFNCTIVRPTMIYGSSEDHNIYKIIGFVNKFKILPLIGGGKNRLQPIYAKDLGEAVYSILVSRRTTMGKCYNLAGKDPMTFLEILKIIAQQLGLKRYYVYVPFRLALFVAYIYYAVAKNPKIIPEQVLRMNEDKVFNYGDATRDFGYNPMSFEVGVKNEIEEFKRLNCFFQVRPIKTPLA
jgi:nucleoside-diphosphate-sugar epimerase